jgi:hypothetical protein
MPVVVARCALVVMMLACAACNIAHLPTPPGESMAMPSGRSDGGGGGSGGGSM